MHRPTSLAYLNGSARIVRFVTFFIITISGCQLSFSQRPLYEIEVSLDTAEQKLTGSVRIRYTNQASVPLDKLAIHLWPNAFQSRNTALVDQMLNLGNLSLYRAKSNGTGGIDHLNFASPDQKITFETTKDPDVAWLILSQPLQPDSSIVITTTFSEKIPLSFSRPGRTGTSYQITQWYPRIAVYDEQGWHPMPYLDTGEFYNDFADYEVKIVAPSGYTVAATGTGSSNKSEGPYTEWTFKATNVIDFAWFASPEFKHEHKVITIGNNHSVDLNIYIDPYLSANWDSAMTYAERAMRFYSDWVGPYPYPQMSVVYAPFSSAGYMEYPMVAQIAYTDSHEYLDRVIAHEIGHTWIYGILSTNERTDPWMDEGFNSFLESQYMKSVYGEDRETPLPGIFRHRSSMNDNDAVLHFVRSQRKLQPPSTPPNKQSNDQYLLSAYVLGPKGLELMRQQVGDAMMKRMYQRYFSDHKFSLITPQDIRSSFESECNCDLSWFFDKWIHYSHEIDYRIDQFDRRENSVSLLNKSEHANALTVSGYRDNKHVETIWLPGFEGKEEVTFENDIDEVRLYDQISPNKFWQRDVKPKALPLIHIFPKLGSNTRNSISVTPIFGYNITDGIMPGAVIMTDILPQPNFKVLLMPFYGIESKEFRYHGDLRYAPDIDFLSFDKLLISLAATRFGYNVDTHYLFRDDYQRISPSIAFRFREADIYSHNTTWLKYRYVNIEQHYGVGDDFFEYEFHRERRAYGIHELSLQMRSDFVLRPYYANASVQAGEGFVRLNLNYNQHFRGRDKNRGIWVRGFAGWLPVLEQPKANVLFFFNGISSNGYSSKDYMYDEWLIGRNAVDGNFIRQVFMKDAGLKTFATNGISEKWMLGGGISTALPFRYLHLYLDAALYPSGITEETELSYSGGLAVILIKDAFEIYLPVLESKDIRESLPYQISKLWHQRITFQASFKFANPFFLIDEYQYKYK